MERVHSVHMFLTNSYDPYVLATLLTLPDIADMIVFHKNGEQ